jgi:hypothetical protein
MSGSARGGVSTNDHVMVMNDGSSAITSSNPFFR